MLATDKWNMGKVGELLWLILSLFILVFFSTNVPELMAKAQIFWWLLISGLVLLGVSFVVPKVSDFHFNLPLWEESPIIPAKYDKLVLIAFIIIGLLTFFFIGQTGYAISAPEFQILELGAWGNALLSFFSATSEDIIFFSVVPALIFGVSYYFTKNLAFSFFLIILLTPFIFLTYHTYRYGFEDIVASVAVYVFGLELAVAMVVLRKLFYCHMRHGFNNFSIIIFRYMSLPTLIALILTNFWVWLIAIFVTVLIIWRFKR